MSAQEQPLPSVPSAVGAVAGHGKGSLYSSEPAVQCAVAVGCVAWPSWSYREGRMLQ